MNWLSDITTWTGLGLEDTLRQQSTEMNAAESSTVRPILASRKTKDKVAINLPFRRWANYRFSATLRRRDEPVSSSGSERSLWRLRHPRDSNDAPL